MQLLLILALLLYGGKTNAKNLMEEVKPVLETFGGDDIKQALKSAEEITEVLSAVQGFAQASGNSFGEFNKKEEENFFTGANGGAAPCKESAPQPEHTGNGTNNDRPISFPLAPISEIADRDITYSLSKYFSQC